ncbi:Phage holin [Fictibacillus macauensis ZFHKF-1]|uniref:Phage holin n=1 Tax=Fictibacillus macauensis ZFHKF-1 TaxID=1196324 RepID=I8AK17_9BACL|nr:phage holin [Fictibacillus macauensis]EIT85894.1 Phage holin [Fictibacillus macauensis ZFHKF-1]
MINWKIRFKNPLWRAAFIAQVFILVELLLTGAHAVGITDFVLSDAIKDWVIAVVNAVFVVLASLGIVQDPTVKGLGDSQRALDREEPLQKKL